MNSPPQDSHRESPLEKGPPDFGVFDHRRLLDQAIILGYAAATGLVAVGFTYCATAASHVFEKIIGSGKYAPYFALVWTPALTVLIIWWMKRFAPGTMGSGIPQVMRALTPELAGNQVKWLVSLRLSAHKIGLVVAGLLAGLSIGREGPFVQVGAGVMSHAKRWLSPRSDIDAHDLMVAGAAAGIAAAFNTPLGGVIFAIEKLSGRRGMKHSSIVIACIVLAGLVSISFFGNLTYFGRLQGHELSWSLFVPGLLVAIATGLAGGLFARLVVASIRGLPDRFTQMRAAHPLRFGAGCALLVAVIGIVSNGATVGAGYEATRALLEGKAELTSVFTILKFCATWLTAWTGVPAGVFAPSLTIGASIGHDVAVLMNVSPQAAIPLVALGMVGFLAASTQGPITAFIIVMEMVSGQSMVLSLMACSLLAGGISRLFTPPMYSALALLLPLPAPQSAQTESSVATGTTKTNANAGKH
ncbi:MAG: chloride channel protein [Casimicrobium sp.]